MPFERSTLTQRRDQVLQDIASSRILDTATGSVVDATMLQTSPLRTLAYALAAAAYEEDGYIDWLALQLVPWTATGEWATAWGALVGITRKPAVSASGLLTVAGPVGRTVDAGTQFGRRDGFTYATSSGISIGSNGVAVLNLVAVEAGVAGNAPVGTALSPTLTLEGITVQAAGAMTGGAAAELDAAFRQRYLQRFASPPQGGAASDYVEWMLAIPGVTRAWARPLGMGAGTVVCYTMWDGNNGSLGFPVGTDGGAMLEDRIAAATGNQLTVANALFKLRPATSLVYSCAPIPYPVAFTFRTRGTVSDTLKAVVADALKSVFLALADPLGGVLDTSPFETEVAAVSGMPQFTLLAPADEFAAPVGYLPCLGAVTWTGAA